MGFVWLKGLIYSNRLRQNLSMSNAPSYSLVRLLLLYSDFTASKKHNKLKIFSSKNESHKPYDSWDLKALQVSKAPVWRSQVAQKITLSGQHLEPKSNWGRGEVFLITPRFQTWGKNCHTTILPSWRRWFGYVFKIKTFLSGRTERDNCKKEEGEPRQFNEYVLTVKHLDFEWLKTARKLV